MDPNRKPDEPTVTALRRQDRERAAGVLARAFTPDPLWSAIMPDDVTRPDQLRRMFQGLIPAAEADRGLVTTTDLDAVAIWSPPGRSMGLRAIVGGGFGLVRMTLAMPRADRSRMFKVMRQLDGRHKALMSSPHWYLMAIGVDSHRQGEGLGAALVRDGLRRADAAGTPTYLETETEGNVGFYEHLGFEVAEHLVVEGAEVPIWLMIRPTPPAA